MYVADTTGKNYYCRREQIDEKLSQFDFYKKKKIFLKIKPEKLF